MAKTTASATRRPARPTGAARPSRAAARTPAHAARPGAAGPARQGPSSPEVIEPEDQARRAQILQVALQVLQAKGYRDTTMLEVATTARASKATLYRHFETKQALFEALVAHTAQDLGGAAAPALAEASSPADALQAWGAWLLTMLTSPPSVAVHRAAIAEASTAPELARHLAEHSRQGMAAAMTTWLRAQMRRGTLPKADAAEAADTLFGLLVGDLHWRALLGLAAPLTPAQARRRAAQAVERFLRLYG